MAILEPDAGPQSFLSIEYRGPAKTEAEFLAADLRTGGISLKSPSEVRGAKATLAIGEIVITIIASSAARALLDVAMEKLRAYLTVRVQERKQGTEAPNLQVAITRENGEVANRKLISLRVASVEFVTKFVKEVGDAFVKAVAKAD